MRCARGERGQGLDGGIEGRGVEPPKSLERAKKVRKRGRRVAIAEATRPMPGSTVDQIALRGYVSLY